MKTFLTTLLLMLSMAAGAQTADALYREGKELYDQKKYKEAVQKLLPAAKQGHKKAQYRMGRAYDKGNGVKADDKQAFQWYMKAAQQGHAKSQYQVGKSYKKGQGVAKDLAKAIHYYQLSANQGNAEAKLALGKCYMKGQGVTKDPGKAKALIVEALADETDGPELLQKLKEKASEGDTDSKNALKLAGK